MFATGPAIALYRSLRCANSANSPRSSCIGHRPWESAQMSTNVVMPQMGESIAEGTIVRWIKKVGETVDRDEPLFEISTDKVDAEIPSPAAGVISEIRVQEGETVPVNSVVAVIGGAAAAKSEPAATPPQPPAPRAHEPQTPPAPTAKPVDTPAPSAQGDGSPATSGSSGSATGASGSKPVAS